MAQCYKCGSDVDVSDRFCMECGTLNPAQAPLPEAAGQPGGPQAIRPTPPTWLPVQNEPSLTFISPPPASPRALLDAADAFPCPRCGAKLPRDARFCGDCGEPIGSPSANLPATSYQPPEVPAQVRQAAPVASVLPPPIAPPASGPADRSAPDLARPVLPPFRASSWAAQPTPEIELPDHTWTPLNAQPAAAPSQMFWAQSAPPPVSPAGAFPGNMPAQPQGFAGVSFPQVAPPTRNRNVHPRSQVITMIVAAIVTVVAATAGVIVQFFVK